MTSIEFEVLADYLQQKYAERVKEVGASFTIRQMARELEVKEEDLEVSEETLRRLMNKRIKKRGLDVRTLRALVRKYDRDVTDILGISPRR